MTKRGVPDLVDAWNALDHLARWLDAAVGHAANGKDVRQELDRLRVRIEDLADCLQPVERMAKASRRATLALVHKPEVPLCETPLAVRNEGHHAVRTRVR